MCPPVPQSVPQPALASVPGSSGLTCGVLEVHNPSAHGLWSAAAREDAGVSVAAAIAPWVVAGALPDVAGLGPSLSVDSWSRLAWVSVVAVPAQAPAKLELT